jgi:predicted outer membrane repeat protein
VTITGNRSNFDGGGIRIQGPTHLFMLQDSLSGSTVISNNASGVDINGVVENTSDIGGGIDVEGFAIADISVTQNFFGGAINHNQASNGGGIATRNGGIVRLFTTIPNQQVSITENTARNHGGGIYSASRSQVCAFGYSISLNTAQNGGAIYTDSDGAGAEFLFGDLDDPTRCAVPHWVTTQLPTNAVYPTFQNEIEANTTIQDDGAAIFIARNTTFDTSSIRGELVHVALNTAGEVIKTQSPGVFPTLLTNCLIDGNSVRHELIHSESDFVMEGCTVANNFIPFGTPMLSTTSPATIRHSIIWQPAINTFKADFTKVIELTDSIVPDAAAIASAGFTQFFGVRSADPLFVNVSTFSGNYRLQAASPAIDYAATTVPTTNPNAAGPTDLAGHLRCGVTLTHVATSCDIGAYERQTPAPPITFPPDETFDELAGNEVPPGLLPAGWTSQNIAGTKNDWVTSGPLAFVGDPATVSDNALVTPAFVVIANARLSFTQLLSLETCCDGVVLEIAIGNGAFTDILAAGGHFVSGGYNAIVGGGNPIAGRSVWNGQGASFEDVVVDLPTAANGQSVRLRWRLASNDSNVGEQDGYFLDTIHLDLNRPNPDDIFKNGFQAPPAL